MAQRIPFLRKRIRRAVPNKTGQNGLYWMGDDFCQDAGIAHSYAILTTGQYAGSTSVETQVQCGAGISFVAATKRIYDSGNNFAKIRTGDTVRIRNSALNDRDFTVATGNTIGYFVVNETVVDEPAGRMVVVSRILPMSNACVLDAASGLMWLRTPSLGWGIIGDGAIYALNSTYYYYLHPAAGDLQMIGSPTNILRIIGGAGDLAVYPAGMAVNLGGFASAGNNKAGYHVLGAEISGVNLDIHLNPYNRALVSEAAGGSRYIRLMSNNQASLIAAVNSAQLAGHIGWRVPNVFEQFSLCDLDVTTGYPTSGVFSSLPANVGTSTTYPSSTASHYSIGFAAGQTGSNGKTTALACMLVRDA